MTLTLEQAEKQRRQIAEELSGIEAELAALPEQERAAIEEQMRSGKRIFGVVNSPLGRLQTRKARLVKTHGNLVTALEIADAHVAEAQGAEQEKDQRRLVGEARTKQRRVRELRAELDTKMALVYSDFAAFADAVESLDEFERVHSHNFENSELAGEWAEAVRVSGEPVPTDLATLADETAAAHGWRRHIETGGNIAVKRLRPQPTTGWYAQPGAREVWSR